MSADREDEHEPKQPEAEPDVADPRRRAALRQLGRTAATIAPATLGWMMMSRGARAY